MDWINEAQSIHLDEGARLEAKSADITTEVVRLKTTVLKAWTRYTRSFTEYWNSLPLDQKVGFLRTASPNLPNNPRDSSVVVNGEVHEVHGVQRLCPELNVEGLTAESGQNLLTVLEQRAKQAEETADCGHEFEGHLDGHDVHYIAQLLQHRALASRDSDALVVLHTGRTMRFTARCPRQERERVASTPGFMLYDNYHYTRYRQAVVFNFLNLLLHNYQVDVLEKRGSSKQVGDVLGCFNCGADKGADGGKLKLCIECQMAHYCSKECQREHWPRHKQMCRETKALRAAKKTDEATAAVEKLRVADVDD